MGILVPITIVKHGPPAIHLLKPEGNLYSYQFLLVGKLPTNSAKGKKHSPPPTYKLMCVLKHIIIQQK